jgi:hypothetical protein
MRPMTSPIPRTSPNNTFVVECYKHGGARKTASSMRLRSVFGAEGVIVDYLKAALLLGLYIEKTNDEANKNNEVYTVSASVE